VKYCPEIVEEIAGYIIEFGKQKDAAILAGITETTFHEWIKDKRKPEFAKSIKRAQAIFKRNRIGRIKKAGKKGTWQADAWLLERLYRDEFSPRQENTGKDGEPLPAPVIILDNGDQTKPEPD